MNRSAPHSFLIGLALAVVAVGNTQVYAASSLTSPLPISQIPLVVPVTAHPQILFAVTNSQSMDGNLSGAIFTGTGDVAGGGAASLTASSSLPTYLVPAGFTAPVSGTVSPNGAAETCTSTTASCPEPAGTEVDNSASPCRLNESKQGIQAIIRHLCRKYFVRDGNLQRVDRWAALHDVGVSDVRIARVYIQRHEHDAACRRGVRPQSLLQRLHCVSHRQEQLYVDLISKPPWHKRSPTGHQQVDGGCAVQRRCRCQRRVVRWCWPVCSLPHLWRREPGHAISAEPDLGAIQCQ